MKNVLMLLLLLCMQQAVQAEEEISIKIGAGCQLSSRQSDSISWDFSSKFNLRVSGTKENVGKLAEKSFIEIRYKDKSVDSFKLSSLPDIDKFKKDDKDANVYHASLASLLSARNAARPIQAVLLRIICGASAKLFTITNNTEGEPLPEALPEPAPCDCEIPGITGTQAADGQSGCANGRMLTYNSCCQPANYFGEELCYYTKNHKTYIYDFNKDIARRGFFKVYKVKGALTAEPVNFNKERLRPRDIVTFKVVHINRFMYNVSIADTLVEFNSEPSPLFNRFFLGDSNLLANLSTAFTNESGPKNGSVNSQTSAVDGAMTPLLCRIQCFIQKYNGLQAKMLQAYNPCSEFPCCAAEDYHVLANDLLEIKLLSARDEPFFNKKLKELNEQKKKRDNYKVKSAELETVQKQLTDVRKKKAEELTPAEKTLLDKEAALAKEVITAADLKTLEGQIAENEELLEPYENLQNLHESLPKISEIRQMILFLNTMIEQNQTYMTEITSLNGNMLDVTLNISAKDSLGRIAPAYSNFSLVRHIELPIVGRMFISFSSGSFIGFSKSLKNKTYEWRKLPGQNNLVADTATYELSESGYSLPPMGIAALMNAEIKIIPDLGLGLSAGVGLTLESKPRVAYLAGGSLFLGNKRQVALTCGIMAVQVEQLSNSLNVGQYTYTTAGRPGITYYKELKVGGFLGLSYTPFMQRPAHKR
jgi:hypothetical protein